MASEVGSVDGEGFWGFPHLCVVLTGEKTPETIQQSWRHQLLGPAQWLPEGETANLGENIVGK